MQSGLCGTWADNLKTGFLTTQLILGDRYSRTTANNYENIHNSCFDAAEPEKKEKQWTKLGSLVLQREVRWLKGRMSDSRARGRGFETYIHRVVSLRKTLCFTVKSLDHVGTVSYSNHTFVVGQAKYGLGFEPWPLLSGLLWLRVVFYLNFLIEPFFQLCWTDGRTNRQTCKVCVPGLNLWIWGHMGN